MHIGQSARSVIFGDAVTGMAAGLSGKIYYAGNGGTTWTGTIKAGASYAALEILEGNRKMWYIGVGGNLLQSVDRSTRGRRHGRAALTTIGGGTGRTRALRMPDGGVTWMAAPLPVPIGMFHRRATGCF